MKTNKIAMSNAVALTTFLLWLSCAVVFYVMPSLYYAVIGTWVHGMDMRSLMSSGESLTNLLVGEVTLPLFTWLTAYVFCVSLEFFSKKK